MLLLPTSKHVRKLNAIEVEIMVEFLFELLQIIYTRVLL
uniref:Uncharacterized protein n=1 Tax=Arundo donax TaxID=35708 RepID=A0A0A9BJ41_ARUDO